MSKMRPQTASKIKKQNKSQFKTQHLNLASANSCTSCRKLYASSNHKNQKIKVFSSLKTIGMVHTYHPQLLNQCLVKDRKSYHNFFSKKGECNMNDVFMKSIIAHFRKWKQQLKSRMAVILDLILESDELLENDLQSKVIVIIDDIQKTTIELRKDIKELLKSDKELSVIKKMFQKFEQLQQNIKHMIILILCLFNFSKAVQTFMMGFKFDIINPTEIVNQLNALTKKYQKEVQISLNYCACHPDNNMLLRLEFKVRQKFIRSTKNIMALIESLKIMTKFQKKFKQKLSELQKNQSFSGEFLQNALQFLIQKNQEIKINNIKFNINQQIKLKVQLLRKQIEQSQTNFIKNIKIKNCRNLRQTLQIINKVRTLQLIKDKGKGLIQLKKRWIMLIKILQQSEKESGINEQIYQKQQKQVTQTIQAVSNAVKGISVPLQQLLQLLNNLQRIRDRIVNKDSKGQQQYVDELKKIQKLQQIIWSVVLSCNQTISKIQNQNIWQIKQNSYSDSQTVENYLQIVFYSKNQYKHNQIFRPASPIKQSQHKDNKTDRIECLLYQFQTKTKLHQQFINISLQVGCSRAAQLKEYSRYQLINYLIGSDWTTQFISGYPAIQNVININAKLSSSVFKQYINNTQFTLLSDCLLEEYRLSINQQIKNIQKIKFKTVFNKFIVFIYQNQLIQMLNIKYLHKLHCLKKQNINLQIHPFSAIIHRFVLIYQNILIKNKKQDSSFATLLSLIYETSLNMDKQNKFINQFKQSTRTNQYFPSITFIQQWLAIQFSYHVQKLISKFAMTNKRKEVQNCFGFFVKKLEGLTEKIQLKQILSNQHQIYAQIKIVISIFKGFSFEQNYQEIITKILYFYRTMKIEHSAIFTDNEQPITLINCIKGPQQLLRLFLNKIHITSKEDKNNLKNFMIPFNSKVKSTKQLKQISSSINIKAKINAITPLKKKNTQHLKEEFIQEIAQSVYADSHIVEDLTQNNKQLAIESIIEVDKQQSKNYKKQTGSESTAYRYWKLLKIESLDKLNTCLLYKNNQLKMIGQSLKPDILIEINKLPESKERILKHIDDILDSVRKHNFIRLLSINDEVSKYEQKLIQFKKYILNNSPTIEDDLFQLLQFFMYKRHILLKEGTNIIQYFKKDDEQVCFVNVNLKQNHYKKHISQFRYKQLQQLIWKQIKMSNLGSDCIQPTFHQQINKCICEFNQQLKQCYNQIKQHFNIVQQLNIKNKDQVQHNIQTFLKTVINNQYLIPQIQQPFPDTYSLYNYLNSLYDQIKQIKIIEPYYELVIQNKVVFINDEPMTDQDMIRCLMIQSISQQKKQQIALHNKFRTIFQKEYFIQILQNNYKDLCPITIKQINQYLTQQTCILTIFQTETDKRQHLITLINKYYKFMSLNQFQQLSKYSALRKQLKQQVQTYSYLLRYHKIPFVQKLQSFNLNKKLKYINSKIQVKESNFVDSTFIKNITERLSKIKVQFFRVIYKDTIIGIVSNNSIEGLSVLMSITTNCMQKLQQNICITDKQIIINKLQLYFINLVPKITQTNKQIKQQIQKQLNEVSLEIKVNSNIRTFNCLSLLKGNNQFSVEIDWFKTNIHLLLYSSNASIAVDILANQYHLFSTIQIVTFHQYFYELYMQIKLKLIQQKKQLQNQLKLQQKLRIQQENERKRKQAEMELDMLRFQKQKLRLLLEKQEMDKQIKRREEEEMQKKMLKTQQMLIQGFFLSQKEKEQLLYYNISLSEGHSVHHFDQSIIINKQKYLRIDTNQDMLQLQLQLSQRQVEDQYKSKPFLSQIKHTQ